MASDSQIGHFLQERLRSRDRAEVSAVEAAAWLDEAGLLGDEPDRPGKPLRKLLRAGRIEGAEQRPPTRNGRWFIVRTGEPAAPRRKPAVPRRSVDREHGASEVFEAARESYRPETIRYLLVGESRPAGGTFFYFRNSILYEATREAFVRARPGAAGREDFLSFFRDAGCFLEDLCSEPVNMLAKPEREAARQRAVPHLARRLRGLDPELVIVVMMAIKPHVSEALAGAGVEGTPVRALPFPRREWRRRYVAELAHLLAED